MRGTASEPPAKNETETPARAQARTGATAEPRHAPAPQAENDANTRRREASPAGTDDKTRRSAPTAQPTETRPPDASQAPTTARTSGNADGGREREPPNKTDDMTTSLRDRRNERMKR